MNHFIDLANLSSEYIHSLINLGCEIKSDPDKYIDALKGRKIGLYFQKPSMRTRVSFEVGVSEMGAFPVTLQANEIQIGKRESIKDVARVLSRYLDGIVMRVFQHSDLIDFSLNSDIPVINGLSDFSHPCQAIADVMTIYEKKGREEINVVYVGDGNNVCNSLIKACNLFGYKITVSCPKGYEPSLSSKEASYVIINDPFEAVREADVVYTDVWTSMGQEEHQIVRRRVFENYRITTKLMDLAANDCIFMHCLPAHRGEEVDDSVIDSDKSAVYDQAENRLHAQKAIMLSLLTD